MSLLFYIVDLLRDLLADVRVDVMRSSLFKLDFWLRRWLLHGTEFDTTSLQFLILLLVFFYRRTRVHLEIGSCKRLSKFVETQLTINKLVCRRFWMHPDHPSVRLSFSKEHWCVHVLKKWFCLISRWALCLSRRLTWFLFLILLYFEVIQVSTSILSGCLVFLFLHRLNLMSN